MQATKVGDDLIHDTVPRHREYTGLQDHRDVVHGLAKSQDVKDDHALVVGVVAEQFDAPHLIDDLITADATIDYTASGGINGTRDEVRDWLAQTLPMFSAMQHYVCQKEVALDGDTASVRVYLMNPMVISQPDGSAWRSTTSPHGWRSRELVEELVWDRKDS